MRVNVLILFLSGFYDFFSIFATQFEQSNIDISHDVYKKGNKRNLNLPNESENTTQKQKSKKYCTNPALNTTPRVSLANRYFNSRVQKPAFLNLFYHGKEVKKTQAAVSIKKYLNVADNIYNYIVPDFIFKIDLNLLGICYNKDIISIQTINSPADLNIENLIKSFTSVFCDSQITDENTTFIVKDKFKYLELMVPEFLPFINFINKLESSLLISMHYFYFIIMIERFNIHLNNWINGYCKIFDNEFISKNIGHKNWIEYNKELDNNHKMLFLQFKLILVDFMELLNVDKKVIKNYRFLIKLHNYKITKSCYSIILDITFFIYFIICAGIEKENYMNRFERYNFIVNKNILTDTEMKDALSSMYLIIDNRIFKSSIFEYNRMLKTFKMPLFTIQDYLDGLNHFHDGKFYGFDFYYCKEDGKYKNRVRFLELWKLLYLNFLRNIFNE